MADEKIKNWNEIKRKVWIKQTWERAKDAAKNTTKATVDFVRENPVAVSVISYAAAEGFKFARKSMQNRKDHDERFRTFYDRRTDTWSESKRDLKSWEKDELEERYKNGESKREILKEFRVLK